MWPDCLSSVLAPAAALDTCTAFLRAESKLHTALLMGGWRGLVGLEGRGGSQIMGLFTNWGGACILRSTLHTQAVSTVPPLQLLVPPEHVNIIGQSGCVYLSTSNNSLGVLRDVSKNASIFSFIAVYKRTFSGTLCGYCSLLSSV